MTDAALSGTTTPTPMPTAAGIDDYKSPVVPTPTTSSGASSGGGGSSDRTPSASGGSPQRRSKASAKLIIGGLILVLLVVALGAVYWLTQQNQDIRQQASEVIYECYRPQVTTCVSAGLFPESCPAGTYPSSAECQQHLGSGGGGKTWKVIQK